MIIVILSVIIVSTIILESFFHVPVIERLLDNDRTILYWTYVVLTSAAFCCLLLLPIFRIKTHENINYIPKNIEETKEYNANIEHYKMCRENYFINWYISSDADKANKR